MLTPKQRRFVDEYLIDLCPSAAYQRAGYSAKGARQNAARLMTNDDVAAAIQAGANRRAARAEVKAADVIAELARIGFSDLRDYTSWGPAGVKLNDSSGLTADQAACVAEVSQTITESGGALRFKLHDKVQALSLLGKHLGLFLDRLRLEGGVQLQLVEEIVDGPAAGPGAKDGAPPPRPAGVPPK